MQNPIVAENFLLESRAARELYHDYAAGMPIIDYHCHLPPAEIARDHRFANLTEVWLQGDHYKWRAMRANGIPEEGITGAASDREKHRNWAATLPYTLRNPLYHWSHLELDRYFGIRDLLGPENADAVYDACGEQLAQPDRSVRCLIERMNVRAICTTDDPVDDLAHHRALAGDESFACRVVPGFRPDKALAIGADGFVDYLARLGAAAGSPVTRFHELITALERRVDYFHALGCRVADHGLNQLYAQAASPEAADASLRQRLAGRAVTPEEARGFQTAVLLALCRMYARRGWTQQFHLGALRNNNARILRTVGADAGVDSIGDFRQAHGLAFLLDTLDSQDELARTIVYNLNPADNEVIATMVGNFNDGSVAGKMQFGAAWWFLDQLDGMEKQLDVLSNIGLISRFVGMLTDSRSFLSFPRHEYFRRLLCNMYGRDIERGLLPDDRAFIGRTIQDICYHNAKNYFNFPA